MSHPPQLPLRRTPRHPWSPLTDAEWAKLHPLLTHRRTTGRPPANLRATWDAIFWVACSSTPWHQLPAHLGKADTVQRALRRAARSGVLNRLLIVVSDDKRVGGWEALRWRISRACRRVGRLLTPVQLLLVKALGLVDALPIPPQHLPRPFMAATLAAMARPMAEPGRNHRAFSKLLYHARRFVRSELRLWQFSA